jgi:hypothetical protein
VSCFSIDRDIIYDIEGGSQGEGVEFSSSEEWSSYIYDSNAWNPGDDMVTDLFYPFEDELSQHTQSDPQSSFGTYSFEDADLFYEDSNHCAHILRNTRTWPPHSSKRFILQRRIIFILDISMEIDRGKDDVFLHLRLFLTSYPLLQETI